MQTTEEHTPATTAPTQATPTPGSLRPSADIAADLAELERRRDAAGLEAERLENEIGRNYADLLDGSGTDAQAEKFAAAHSLTRRLAIACTAAAADLAVAKKREADEERRATLKSLSLILDRRAAVGDELEIVLEQLCTKLLQVRDVQREALTLMQRSKKSMPLEERAGIRILDSVQQFADPDMLRRWIAMGVRHRVPDLFDAELGNMAVRFGDSVRTTNLQAMSEMRWLLNIDESAAE